VRAAFGQTLESGIGALAWAGGLSLLARIWGSLLVDVNSPAYAAAMHQVVFITTVAFLGWVLLIFLRAYFDTYATPATATGPVDEDAPAVASIPSRLGTMISVLRGVVLGAVIAVTALILISRLGVDIAPLLAGFGILGLAVSFGSQALVRDIVSGFFFLMEDAFRVGEYVDTGRLKGTVEKISLRSMQLRHQSGLIHTVPFGQIPSLTNASRDWSTVKFNLRLDRDVDVEKARKAIKKVGQAMMEDPEIAPYLIEPLKMQGVADITDSCIIVRLKFTAKPAEASTVQRNALKQVYLSFKEAGIPFASNAVTVNSTDERVAAAAVKAVQSSAATTAPAS
jgi:small-conductance mechanosensitive channel